MSGPPPSANGASSLHLRWDLAGPLAALSVDVTVLDPPTVPRLYFWALQADFADAAGQPAGGAHLGLQWHPGHPGSTAVNWGGYRAGGGELAGSDSPLPSRMGNANTRDFRWHPGRPYRLSISPVGTPEQPLDPAPPSGISAWRATVEDLGSGEVTVVRDLHVAADRITGAIVWSEVFARCDDASTSVLWSEPRATTHGGEATGPGRASVNYQSERDGGCANTDSRPFGEGGPTGIVQRTNCERTTAQGSVIPWP